MIKSLLDLKNELTDVMRITNRRDLELEDFNWETIAGMVVLLPFEETTTELSSQFYSSLSKVIPAVKILLRRLSSLVTTEYNS